MDECVGATWQASKLVCWYVFQGSIGCEETRKKEEERGKSKDAI